MHSFVARHYLDGANYPTGTSRKIAETISDLIEKNGGSLYVNAPVKSIEVNKSKATGVVMDNGEIIRSRSIISNAGVFNTVNQLLNHNKSNSILSNQMKNIRQTKSYVCLHLGLNKSAEDLDIKNTNLWIYFDYDHDKAVQNYIDNPKSDFPVVYVSFPSAKDNDWSEKHPNKATIEAITLSRMRWYKKWKHLDWKKRGSDYEEDKKILSKRMLNVIEKHVGGLKGNIDHQELSTPLTVRDLANYTEGEMYGIDHSPDRFRQRWLRPQSSTKNLYFVGQDITTVGVSSALFSGLLTASTVLGQNLSSLLKD